MNRLVIFFPALVFIFILSWSASNILAAKGIEIPIPPVIANMIKNSQFRDLIATELPYTSSYELMQTISTLRIQEDLDPLTHDIELCTQFTDWNDSTSSSIFATCKNCSHAAIIKISSQVYPEAMKSYLTQDGSAAEIIHDPNISHICLNKKDDMHTVFMMAYRQPTNQPPMVIPSNKVTYQPAPPPAVIKDFTQEELWQALTEYRQAHEVSHLTQDDKLCSYAKKRVQDHIDDYATKEPEEYPVPEKYPLDAHTGFSEDADSGYAFETTDKNKLAENLAYWPGAEYANQIIEWGWDSSTEGHRETQLSNEYSSVCISGQDGFYVAIFGK